jgi:RecA-family ATPase
MGENLTVSEKAMGYIFTWNKEHLKIHVRNINKNKQDVTAFMTVYDTSEGRDSTIMGSGLSLTNRTSVYGIRQDLLKKVPTGVDWDNVIETMVNGVMTRFSKGQPVIKINSDDVRESEHHQLIITPFLYDGNATLWYGEGKCGKSYVALACALNLQGYNILPITTTPTRCLYLDWETNETTFRIRVKRLSKGHGLKNVELLYRKCESPFVEDIEQIYELCQQNDVRVVIIDSLGYACADQELNNSRSATRFFSSLARLRCSSLLITHTQKNFMVKGKNMQPKTAFGSSYYTTSARSVWEVKKREEYGGEKLTVSTFKHHFNNLGPRFNPITFNINHDDVEKQTRIALGDSTQEEIQDEEMPLGYRMKILLEIEGGYTAQQLADKLEAKKDAIYKVIQRDNNKTFKEIDHRYWMATDMFTDNVPKEVKKTVEIKETEDTDDFE